MNGEALAVLRARLDPRSTAPVAVAVSGGGDSMALLDLAAAWAAGVGRRLLVLTVDHGLNGDSATWTEFVRTRAAALGCPTRVLAWTGAKPKTGLPAAARAARHALLAEAARQAGARVILLGHTADDRAESDWMRDAGSTLGRLRPWGPSPAWPEGRGLMLLRPLLALTRAELRAALVARGLSWLEDPANIDLRFARSRARAALSARGQGSNADHPPPAMGPAFSSLEVSEPSPGVLRLDRTELIGMGDRGPAALSAALLCASGRSRPPRGEGVAALLTRLTGAEPITATLGGARLAASSEAVLIGRDPGRAGLPVLSAEPGRAQVWDGRFEFTLADAGRVRSAAGCMNRLSASERQQLGRAAAWARGGVPVVESPSGAVRLLPALSLVRSRLLAGQGRYGTEADLPCAAVSAAG